MSDASDIEEEQKEVKEEWGAREIQKVGMM